MTAPSNPTQLELLETAIQEERKDGLIEVAFYPGTDREVTNEDGAKVALDMLRRFKDGEYIDITDRPL